MIYLVLMPILLLVAYVWAGMTLGGAIVSAPPNQNIRTKLILKTIYIDIISVIGLGLFLYGSFGYGLYLFLMVAKLTFINSLYNHDSIESYIHEED